MRIIIPTRNRPTSLEGVLGYYDRFYPDAQIILADGSSEEFATANKRLAAKSSIAVEYRAFDPELSLFDRLLTLIRDENDAYFIMAADDDYPIVETLEKAQLRLERRPDAVCAGGYLVHLTLDNHGNANARLDPVRQVTADTAERRMRVFGQMPFTTTYAVARRELLIDRYEFLRSWNIPGFFDLGVGLMDVAAGQFLAIPEMGFICTRNSIHSYYRADEPLVYLRHAAEILHLYDLLADRVQAVDGISEEDARAMLGIVIGHRVAALAGAPFYKLEGFAGKAPYATPIIEKAREMFESTFLPDGEQRKLYDERLAYIARCLEKTIQSDDNAGESRKYEKF